jgi:Cu+-exporting ATPase
MHPEVQQDHPSECPKCGMALELMNGNASDAVETAELTDMTRRFWIGAVLTLPVFILAMAHMVPALVRRPWVTGDASRWIQFVLTTPVVWWAGWPFIQRGWRSVTSMNLNMFTLIAIGVGNQCLIVNGTFETDCPEDKTAQAMQRRGLSA